MKKLIFTLVILAFVSSVNAQWVKYSYGIGNYIAASFLLSGNTLFTGTEGQNSGPGAGVYSSPNYGLNWNYSGLTPNNVRCMAVSGTNIFAGTLGSGIFLSTDNGWVWTAVNNGITNLRIISLAVSGTNVLAAQDGFTGLYRTTNNGGNWVPYGLTGLWIMSLSVSGNNVYAGTSGGVYYSSDNGANWTPTSPISAYAYSFAISGTKVFAGCNGGKVFLTTNNGANWTLVNNGLPNEKVVLAVSGSNLFAGIDGQYGVYLSTNNGNNWIPKNEGFSWTPNTLAFIIVNNYLFAGTADQVWRRPLSDFIGIKQISEIVPSAYSLSQNYPNPFNPTTKIKFDVVRVGDVKIVVYDVMGREVQTLVNESLKPGTYEASFDGSSLNSGVYFYKITTGNFVETKKMLMIK